ncbi:MAG: VOC family protein [Candidatus Bathyarchaeota archaeon]|nr:VOC family protein [Candidatus Bathyarchaeota archaeon]MDH5713069.1 VOC family protein [Candidatus Bathyarchaeota archaeon]
MNERIRINEVAHICMLVDDIEKALERVNQTFEIPPVKVEEYTSTARLRGKDLGKYNVKLAFVKIASNMTLELLQISEGKSIEQDWLKNHGETIHHIAIKVDDLEKEAAKWEKKGVKILQEDHGKWIYLDTEKILGMNIELIPSE